MHTNHSSLCFVVLQYSWLICCPLCHCGYIYCQYSDAIMGVIASEMTRLAIVCSPVYSGADQRKDQNSASLAFVRGIPRCRWIPRTMASNADNYSIWWCHHDLTHWPWQIWIWNILVSDILNIPCGNSIGWVQCIYTMKPTVNDTVFFLSWHSKCLEIS